MSLSACASDLAWLEPPPPTSPPSRALLVASKGTRGLELHALALAADGTLASPVRLDPPVDGAVEALLYTATLDALGLEEGELRAPADGEDSRPVPQPDHVLAAHVRADRTSGWTERTAPSDALQSFRFSGGPPECARFDPLVLDLETAADGTFAVAVDDARVLLGTSDGRTYVVERSGRLGAIDVVPPRVIWGAVRGEAGDLWLGAEGGELLRAALGDTLDVTPLVRAPSGERLHWLDGGTGPDGFELHTLSLEGTFERFRLGRWARVHQFAPGTPGAWVGGVARLGQNTALAAWPNVSTAVRASGDEAVLEDTGSLAGLAAIADVPGLGTVAGTSGGSFYLRQSGVWHELVGSRFAFAVEAVTPYEDGFVYGGAIGNFGQWRPGIGYCALTQPAPHWIQHIAKIGDDLVLVGPNGGTYAKTPITVLHRVRRR